MRRQEVRGHILGSGSRRNGTNHEEGRISGSGKRRSIPITTEIVFCSKSAQNRSSFYHPHLIQFSTWKEKTDRFERERKPKSDDRSARCSQYNRSPSLFFDFASADAAASPGGSGRRLRDSLRGVPRSHGPAPQARGACPPADGDRKTEQFNAKLRPEEERKERRSDFGRYSCAQFSDPVMDETHYNGRHTHIL